MQTFPQTIEPYNLIDEVSETEFFIGTSINGSAEGAPYWRIKRIWKEGNVIKMGFPDGKQTYEFVWTDRAGYDYN